MWFWKITLLTWKNPQTLISLTLYLLTSISHSRHRTILAICHISLVTYVQGVYRQCFLTCTSSRCWHRSTQAGSTDDQHWLCLRGRWETFSFGIRESCSLSAIAARIHVVFWISLITRSRLANDENVSPTCKPKSIQAAMIACGSGKHACAFVYPDACVNCFRRSSSIGRLLTFGTIAISFFILAMRLSLDDHAFRWHDRIQDHQISYVALTCRSLRALLMLRIVTHVTPLLTLRLLTP